MAKRMRAVQVDWVDAATNNSWRDTKSLDASETIEIRTLGYLLRSTPKELVVAQSRHEDNYRIGGTLAIPRACVKKIRPIGRL